MEISRKEYASKREERRSRWLRADFNRDGFVDLAFSHLGTGLLTVIYADANQSYRHFRTFASDVYRDYIAAADTSGTGNTELLAMNFANYATVLLDFS